MRSQQANHKRTRLDHEEGREAKEIIKEQSISFLFIQNDTSCKKYNSQSQSINPHNFIDNNKKKEIRKKKNFNQEINYLARKIERSTLSELETKSRYYHIQSVQNSHTLQGFISELSEMITNDHNNTMKYHQLDLSKMNFVQREDDYIRITLIKSNVDLRTISQEYIIGEKGLPCSQKTYGRDYISFGRQQINEDYKRPNDIMLFPTDPSISRSHCKIYHKSLFEHIKLYKEQEKVLMQCDLPLEFILNILQYLKPKLELSIEDNETIYGTYCKVKPFSIENIFINIYLAITHSLNSSVKYNRKHKLSFDNKLKAFISIYSHIPDIHHIIQLITKHLELEMYKELHVYLIKILAKHFPDELFEPYSTEIKEHRSLLNENNIILSEQMVFLTSPKNGLIVRYIKPLLEILELYYINRYIRAIEIEFSTITVVSHVQIFNEQSFDGECYLYKMTIYGNRIIIGMNAHLVFHDMNELKVYDSILLVETVGDPCGIMNRQGGLLFIYNKTQPIPDCKSFTFNMAQGFLLGRSVRKAYYIDIESDIMLYYSPIDSGSWMLTDLTLFLNPTIYNSILYFGLWICTSPDKFNSNRFSRTLHSIRDNDEVRLSESVLKFEFFFH